MKALFTVFFAALTFMFVGTQAHAQLSGAGNSKFTQEYIYDYSVDGGASGTISLLSPAAALPVGAVVTQGHYMVLTPFVASGSATVAIGDAGSAARYKAAVASNDSSYTLNTPVALSTSIPLLVSSSSVGNVSLQVSGTLTAGKLRVVIEGYKPKTQ